MYRWHFALAGITLLAPTFAFGADDGRVPLKKDDRIVMFGDSITQGGGGAKGYVTVVQKVLDEKYKDLGIKVLNAGISGHKVPNLQKRVDKDVIAKKPTLVFIYIGINDVWHGEKDPARGTSKEAFESGLKDLVDRLTTAGAKVILCTPSVIGEKKIGTNNLDGKLDEYAEISRNVAKEKKIPLCDLRKAFVDYLKTNNPENKDRQILTNDGVHLNDAGNKLVAETMLAMLAGPATK